MSPRPGCSEVVSRYGDGWRIRVAAPPERGRANAALVALLAEVLAVSPKSLSVVGGRASRHKVVEVTGLGAVDVDRRLAAACTG